jgi:hypothetical protein
VTPRIYYLESKFWNGAYRDISAADLAADVNCIMCPARTRRPAAWETPFRRLGRPPPARIRDLYQYVSLFVFLVPSNLMAASATVTHRQVKAAPVRQAKNSNEVGREPVSFHLAFLLGNDYILPDGHDSVDVLRSPFISKTSKENLTGTKLEFWTKRFITSSLPLDGADGEDKESRIIRT